MRYANHFLALQSDIKFLSLHWPYAIFRLFHNNIRFSLFSFALYLLPHITACTYPRLMATAMQALYYLELIIETGFLSLGNDASTERVIS